MVFSSANLFAQDEVFLGSEEVEVIVNNDSLDVVDANVGEDTSLLTYSDSLVVDSVDVQSVIEELVIEKSAFKPDPTRAVIYSAIFPGLGQIYNRKYWKLPIVYGGFLGCIYAITWNGNQYDGYKDAFNDFGNGTPSGDSWRSYVPYSMPGNVDEWTDQQKTWFNSALKSKKDYYRRYRDLSYIVTVGLYALCMIDAYVDAQLFDFDISEDLSMRMDPVLMPRTSTSAQSFGLQCSFVF